MASPDLAFADYIVLFCSVSLYPYEMAGICVKHPALKSPVSSRNKSSSLTFCVLRFPFSVFHPSFEQPGEIEPN
jgi:hypothetical protein